MARKPLTNPRKNASQDRSRATVDALIEATARILVREGFDKASTNRIAEKAGVTMAAHPDDTPLPTMRGQPRLVYQPQMYQRLIDLNPSSANKLEFCLGTLAEMTEGDIYDTVDKYSHQGRLAYVHFRNVTGKVPHYRETFVDDGDIDMLRVIRILKANKFEGVLIPDHTPQMTCGAPWHAGMAYAMGYMRAALQVIDGIGVPK